METIKVSKINEVWLKIDCSQGCKRELNEYFSFYAPNYRFHKLFKQKRWDGKIRMYRLKDSTIYVGLMKKIAIFCKERGYKLDCDFEATDKSFSEVEFDEIIKEFNLTKTPRPYQKKAVIRAIRKKRVTFLSPTASGKSFIIYLILRILNVRSLLIVPTTSLCLQMKSDFEEYSENDVWHADDEVSIIMSGYSKENLNQITVSTWQSLKDLPKKWFDDNDFQCVILDEAHSSQAKMIGSIMEKITDAPYRIGLTGTLQDTSMGEFSAEGLFGPIYEVTETKKLIDDGTLSDLLIKAIVFNYSDESKKNLPRDYKTEIDFLLKHEKRNKFLMNLALSQHGSTLLLFGKIEHGKYLYEELAKNTLGKKVFYISGEIKASEREEIRKIVEDEKKDCIIVASTGTFSTGVNVINLHNIIQAHPTKAKIKILQSIGRGLRKGGDKNKCLYFDIADDLKWKSRKNYTYEHFTARLKMFVESNFPYKIYKVDLEK